MFIIPFFLFVNLCSPGGILSKSDTSRFLIDDHGAIIRGDVSKKEIALVLTGDEFADGGDVIRNTLRVHQVHASFFLTGNFYANPNFKILLDNLKNDGHYMGAHSDKHLLYADWTLRDSLLVSEKQFKDDLKVNYNRMSSFGIRKKDSPYFLPPYEWYNSTIASWTKEMNLTLINFTPGTRSAADYTYPGLESRYVSSEDIYKSIFLHEEKDPNGLNGFILLIHIGTDPRRTDKFYYKLDKLLTTLKEKGYGFLKITELLRD
jgi:peptidoglycan/xylan/chitin deacetylase (PgdA/CDA1 family)